MNIQTAIEVLSNFDMQVTEKANGTCQSTVGKSACKYAIEALKQLEQYRKIGSLEKCKSAVEWFREERRRKPAIAGHWVFPKSKRY